jgi:hypothetical protein
VERNGQRTLRGRPPAQPEFLTTLHRPPRVPADPPLRGIKARVAQVRVRLSLWFDELSAHEGRPSIPPGQLPKGRILRALSADVAKLFFVEGYDLSRQAGWTSDQPFTAEGTRVEAWARRKRFVRKDGTDRHKIASVQDDDPGHPTVNFHGEQRRNAPHPSTTDPEGVLGRKAQGQASKLCFGTPVLVEHRHGLCAAITVHNPIAPAEPTVALAPEDEHRELHAARLTTLGGDRAYHQQKFAAGCRERGVAPHVAGKARVQVSGLDGRTTGRAGYRTSQRIRKRVEEIFGWMKTVGGLRRSRHRGVERTQARACFVAGTDHLLRSTNRGLSWQAG